MNENEKESKNVKLGVLEEVANMSVDELTNLEQQLASEFNTLSKEYLESRLSRINTILDKLNSLIKYATANDKSWLKIYNFEIETINSIMTNTEDLIISNNGDLKNKPDLLKSIDEYQEELKEIFKNLQSPFDFDSTFRYDNDDKLNDGSNPNLSKLPFSHLFNDYFKKHRDALNAIIKEKDYQANLLHNNLYGNRVILWKQYYNKLNQQKQKLIDKTNDQLNQLYKDYYHLNEQKNLDFSERHYYRSLLTPKELATTIDDSINTVDTQDVAAVLETNHDSNYVELDTRHKSKNKIEISDIRKKIIDEDQMLNNISCGIKRSWDETDTNTSIDPLKRSRFSLTDAEAIEDLLLIRHNITKQNSHHEQNKNQQKEGIEQNQENQLEEVDIDEAEEEEGQEQSLQHNQEGVEREGEEEEEYGEEMDSDNDREETEAPIESILTSEQKNQRELYKEIIFKNDSTEGMKIQSLPPLDCFPRFFN